MTYKLFRKTKIDAKYRLMNYCYSKDYAIKLINLYKKRKLIIMGEKKAIKQNSQMANNTYHKI